MDLIIYFLGLVAVCILSWGMVKGVTILEHKIKKYESSRVYQWIRRNIMFFFLDGSDNNEKEKDDSDPHS